MDTRNKLRFGFYVSGKASRLVKLIQQNSEIIENTFVVVNDDAPNQYLNEHLNSRNIEYVEFDYKEKGLTGKNKNSYISDLLLREFEQHNIDYAFCFGGRILQGSLLSIYKNKIINFHPAVLPMFPGVKSIDQALLSNSFLLGNTAHFVDEGVDTGPVIMQSIKHSAHFSDYEDVLGLQLPMINQIFIWLNEKRITIENKSVKISDADYSQTTFLPNLEFNQK